VLSGEIIDVFARAAISDVITDVNSDCCNPIPVKNFSSQESPAPCPDVTHLKRSISPMTVLGSRVCVGTLQQSFLGHTRIGGGGAVADSSSEADDSG
jgi:hypothetical protein